MLPSYHDIRKRIKEKPLWYDENGVPRYDPFHPDLLPDIYADEGVLVKIQCQDSTCGKTFLVGISYNRTWIAVNSNAQTLGGIPTLRQRIERFKADPSMCLPVHYGDPPRHAHSQDGWCAGETMNCWDLKIEEFWEKDRDRKSPTWFQWVRQPELEIELEKPED